MNIFERMDFWDKLEKTLAITGAVGITTAGFQDAPNWVFISFGISALIGKIIFIWVEDKNKDGVVDFVEDNNVEVTINETKV